MSLLIMYNAERPSLTKSSLIFLCMPCKIRMRFSQKRSMESTAYEEKGESCEISLPSFPQLFSLSPVVLVAVSCTILLHQTSFPGEKQLREERSFEIPFSCISRARASGYFPTIL